MLSKPAVVVAAVAVMCAVGAGTGAFLAVRQNASMPSAAAASLADPGADVPAAAPQPALAPTSDTVVPVDDVAAEPPAKADKKDETEPPEPKPVTRKRARPRPAPEPIAPAPVPVTQPEPAPPAPAPDSSSSIEPVAPPPAVEYTPERREPIVERLVVSADAVIGLQMETSHTTELARLEDRAEARVTRDVTVGDRTAIPAGTRMIGSVTVVEKGGKVRERARLGVRFHTLVLADGTTVPLQTETIFREGDSPSKESAAKIGGAAVGGAILGAIFGGTKGAIIGGSTGAAGGTAAVMAGDRKPAMLNAGTGVTVRLSSPVTVMVERN